MLLREIKGDPNKWRDIVWLYMGRLHSNISILSKIIFRFSVIPIKILVHKLILKCIWKCKEFRIDKTTLRKKKTMRELTLLHFKGLL